MKLATFRADGLLLLAAVIWGAGFAAQKAGMEFIGPYAYTGVRFAIAALAMLPLLLIKSARDQPGEDEGKNSRKAMYLGGLLAGIAIAIGGELQQVGISLTSASNAGFITSLYVVVVPILGLCVGYAIRLNTWIGIGLATIGLYFLSVYDFDEVNIGDMLVLLGTIAWAVQVLVIGWASPRTDPIRLAVIQTSVAGVICLLVAIIVEGLAWDSIWAARWYLLYSGVLATSVAFTLQIISQRDAPPAHAAMLLSLEAIFAAIAGYIFLHERFTDFQLLGCVIMLAGILVVQVKRSERRRYLDKAGPMISNADEVNNDA